MEKLSLRPYPITISISEDIHDVQRFTPVIKLRFMADDDMNKSASVNIDFTLYSMFCDINQGYRPTVKDENTHVDFLSFVQHFFEFGEKNRRITLIPKYGIDNKKIVFEESVFSDRFEFRVD